MTTQTIQITSETREKIERLIAAGEYTDASAVLDAALRLLEAHDRKLAWLRAELAIGEEQEKRGELVDLTPERLEAIKRQAIENAKAGKPVKDAVKP